MQTAHREVLSGAPRMEALEARLMLSGTITTSLAAGNLTIAGDVSANNITIRKAENTVQITANDSESFAGLGATVAGATGTIRILMGAGNDTLTIGEEAGLFWVGNDTPPNPWPNRMNPRDLSVDLGDGADGLTMIGLRARNVSVLGGTGFNTITIRDNGGGDWLNHSTFVYGALAIVNGDCGGDVTLAGVHVVRNCSVTMGGGGTVTLREDTHQDGGFPAPSFTTWVGGNLSILGGAGNDVVRLTSAVADWTLDVEGNLVVSLKGAAEGGANELHLDNVEVMGGLTCTGGAGDDNVYINGEVDVDLSATFNLMGGANMLQIASDGQLWVGRDLTYTGGAGTDSVTGGQVGVDRSATLNLGEGQNTVSLQSGGDELLDVGRNLAISGGAGNDSVRFFGSAGECDIGGSATFKLGNGSNSLTCDGGADGFWTGGGFTYTGGTGVDSLTWNEACLVVSRDLTLNLGGGNNAVNINPNSPGDSPGLGVFGSLNCKTGGGDDSLTFAGQGMFLVSGNATFDLGAGVNSLVLGGVTGFDVWGNLAYIGGLGEDTLDVQSGDVTVGGSASFRPMDGTNKFSFCADEKEFEVAGDLTYVGGAGADELRGAGWARIFGDATVRLGDGTNVVNFTNNTTYDEPLGVGGDLSITGGAGDDSLTFSDSWVDGDCVLTLGNGTNNLILRSDIGGKMTYAGGTGEDNLYLRRLYVLGPTQIRTGDHADTVAMYDDTSLSRLDLDTGAGNDDVFLGDDALRTGGWGFSSIKDTVTVRTGSGDDRLFVGFAGGGLSMLLVGEAVLLDGGAGTNDVLTFGDVLAVFVPTLLNWEPV